MKTFVEFLNESNSSERKKPYIKLFSEIEKYKVWIVDGNYVRTNIDEEFTNFACHDRFKFIPKNEFWIDNEAENNEEKFYIDHLLMLRKLIDQGKTYQQAEKSAIMKEKDERHSSGGIKNTRGLKSKCPINKIHESLWKTINGIKVWIVYGEKVRKNCWINFTEGGHYYVYSFIPKDEIWIDNDISEKERPFILVHEMHERNLMKNKNMKYDNAHKHASAIEFYHRHHKDDIWKIINKNAI